MTTATFTLIRVLSRAASGTFFRVRLLLFLHLGVSGGGLTDATYHSEADWPTNRQTNFWTSIRNKRFRPYSSKKERKKNQFHGHRMEWNFTQLLINYYACKEIWVGPRYIHHLSFCLSELGNKMKKCIFVSTAPSPLLSAGDATDENVWGMCCEKVSAATEGIVVRAFGGGRGG